MKLLITNDYRQTYRQRMFGILVDVAPHNIIQAYFENIASGGEKGEAELHNTLSDAQHIMRTFVRERVKSALGLTDKEFASLFVRWCNGATTQEENQTIRVAADSILKENPKKHNEVVVYNLRM